MIGSFLSITRASPSVGGRAIAYGSRLAPVPSPLVPPCGGGRLARHPKSAIADFGFHIGQVGNIRLGMHEPGGGYKARRIKQTPPSPSLPLKGGGSRMWLALTHIR